MKNTELRLIYIVENEMVFSHLLSELLGGNFSLLCTSEQRPTAAFALLYRLVKIGARLFYAEDQNPEGVLIADWLWRRYPERLSTG